MEGRLSVLSVECSAVTAVPFVVYGGRLSVLSVERSAVTAVPFIVYGRQAECSVCGTQCCDCSTTFGIWKACLVFCLWNAVLLLQYHLWYMEGKLSLLSVKRSAVTEVQLVVY